MKEIDKIIAREIPENERLGVFTRCGVTQERFASVFTEEGAHTGLFGVKLVPRIKRGRSVKDVAAAIRKKINEARGELQIAKFRIETGDQMSGMMAGGEQPLTVNVVGKDLDAMEKVAATVKRIAEDTPGAVDITVSRDKGRPELWINMDRRQASQLGASASSLGNAARSAFYGRIAGKYRIHGEEYDIFVRLREQDRREPGDIAAAPVRLAAGPILRADGLAELSNEFGPIEIERKDQGRIIRVMGNVYGRSLGDVTAEIERKLRNLNVPPGIEVLVAGQREDQRESFFWLGMCLIVGMILVYMVMASQFESLLDPFVVMFSVPFALTGTLWALFLSGNHISVIVLLGLLMLIGIVVNNAIVLVDYTNVLRQRGMNIAEAVRTAGRTRLRPVLMTALTTVFGLTPMAFGRGQGAEVWNPLGLTVMGGLIVSTVVTLILVPTMYSIFEQLRSRLAARRTPG